MVIVRLSAPRPASCALLLARSASDVILCLPRDQRAPYGSTWHLKIRFRAASSAADSGRAQPLPRNSQALTGGNSSPIGSASPGKADLLGWGEFRVRPWCRDVGVEIPN